jgi:hypothetical protein
MRSAGIGRLHMTAVAFGSPGIEGIQSGVLLGNTGLTAGQAYGEMADLLLHELAAGPDRLSVAAAVTTV